MFDLFKIRNYFQLFEEISFYHIEFNDGKDGQAIGRSLIIKLDEVDPRIYIFEDLVNRSFITVDHSSPEPLPNFGTNIPQFIFQRKKLSEEEFSGCLLACNILHTNYVRGNGFVITEGKFIYKPPGAIAIDGKSYVPLEGIYHSLIIAPGTPQVQNLTVKNNILHAESSISLAISGPRIVAEGQNVVKSIPIRKAHEGQTIGNEINYSPFDDRTSFTAFGLTHKGAFIAVSMFAGRRHKSDHVHLFQPAENKGITMNEMADLLISLGAKDAIAGGGSGDTQQYIKDKGIWASAPRIQANRGQVQGLRGLGAILCILSKKYMNI